MVTSVGASSRNICYPVLARRYLANITTVAVGEVLPYVEPSLVVWVFALALFTATMLIVLHTMLRVTSNRALDWPLCGGVQEFVCNMFRKASVMMRSGTRHENPGSPTPGTPVRDTNRTGQFVCCVLGQS